MLESNENLGFHGQVEPPINFFCGGRKSALATISTTGDIECKDNKEMPNSPSLPFCLSCILNPQALFINCTSILRKLHPLKPYGYSKPNCSNLHGQGWSVPVRVTCASIGGGGGGYMCLMILEASSKMASFSLSLSLYLVYMLRIGHWSTLKLISCHN